MAKYSNQDHYLDPETGILKNRLGIRDEHILEKAEATFTSWRSYDLSKHPIKGHFDLKHLKAIHRYLFCDLYDWAGELRTIDISKGNSYFAHYNHIDVSAKHIFNELSKENHLTGLDIENFCKRTAYYHAEINALHPFREGNGRAQREFISQLAQQNGFVIEWKNISPDSLLEASIQAFKGETNPLRMLIRRNLKSSP